jgi:hypothetical protein
MIMINHLNGKEIVLPTKVGIFPHRTTIQPDLSYSKLCATRAVTCVKNAMRLR